MVMKDEKYKNMETRNYALNQAAAKFCSCKHGSSQMPEMIDDFVDVFFCPETNFWHLSHVNGMTSLNGFYTKIHAKMAANDGAVVWEH